MADQDLYQERCRTPEVVALYGSFAPNNTDPIADVDADGFTVTRTGAGAFLVTLSKKYYRLLNFKAELFITAGDFNVRGGAVSMSAGTIAFSTVTAGTPTDIPANAANRVYISIKLQNRKQRR